MKQRIVVWLEQLCVFFDAAPAWYKEDGEMAGLATRYCPLGDVWWHPLASWSQFLDQRWHTGVWQVKETS